MLTALRRLRPPVAALIAALFVLGFLAGSPDAQAHETGEIGHAEGAHAGAADPGHAGAANPAPTDRRHPDHAGPSGPGHAGSRHGDDALASHAHSAPAQHLELQPSPGDDSAGHDRERVHADHGCDGCACIALAGCSAPALPSAQAPTQHLPAASGFCLRDAVTAPETPPCQHIFRPPRS